ncbi:hypothetical protein B488_00080 [Liberibacter crescens BT-1]|uniref:Pyridoxal phosphate homeostasis protein n=1 Tax=Liberibacter crescens (strain BT-1) TaxID=1215343 RepID=L0EUG3_LIBCB|nr:YggS family pyridoxal phosphate-dependent enzyme [Liberibacter crescens]AGA64001.1 hypothetical protein B488_00080 [Liberibacter crescens BT-1]AMC12312.1 alanine racemase [Liberibacter crescens]
MLEERLYEVKQKILNSEISANRAVNSVSLVAVSKNCNIEKIRLALVCGQRVFGENRVQEAKRKWTTLKKEYPVELRLIGPLQSNKVVEAVELFDIIEAVYREKIACSLAIEMNKQKRKLPIYIQVNTGLEEQKAGVMPKDTKRFVSLCQQKFGLIVEGLMCIPPVNEIPGPHFALLAKLAKECNVQKLSMGMSQDYETAISFGSTSVRIGTSIFGNR